jgi:hypothetical protein
MSPSDWERKASHADRQAEQLAAEGRIADAVVLSVQAQRYREVAEEMRRALTGPNKARKVRHTMAEVSQAEAPPKTGRGRPRTSQHAFPLALEAKGLTVAEWARERKLERSVVRSWFASKARDGRSIPRYWADAIKAEFGIPATATVWKHGIRD